MATEAAGVPDGHAVARLALQRFAAHLATGDTRAALQAASDACHTAPQLPEPYYAYGQAWHAPPPHALTCFPSSRSRDRRESTPSGHVE